MFGGGMGWEDTLFIVVTIGIAVCALFIGSIVGAEGRRRSDIRAIKSHLGH